MKKYLKPYKRHELNNQNKIIATQTSFETEAEDASSVT